MKHIQLLTTDFLALEYNAIDDYLLATWQGELRSDAIMQGYENILLFLRKEHCHKLLDDHSKVQGIWVDLAEWYANDWKPRASAAGLKYHAVVYSTSHFSKLSTEKAVQLAKNGITEGFDTMQDAEGWLKFM